MTRMQFDRPAPEIILKEKLLKSESAAECASQALRAAGLGLPNVSWKEPKQLRLPDHPPLQSYPRLTAANFATQCKDGAWYVPYLIEASEETIKNGPDEPRDSPSMTGIEPERTLTFWLEPAGGDGSPAKLIHVTEVIPLSEIPGGGDPDPFRRHGFTGVVLRVPGAELNGRVKPGFYWIRVAPRFPPDDTTREFQASVETGQAARDSELSVAILTGDLKTVLEYVTTALDKNSRPRHGRRSRDSDTIAPVIPFRVASTLGINGSFDSNYPYKHFWRRMNAVSEADEQKTADQAAFLLALWDLYGEDRSPAGVFLDDPNQASTPYSFIVTADNQNSRENYGLRRFLETADGHLRYERGAEMQDALNNELEKHDLTEVSFVLFAGDLADASMGSDPVRVVFNFFGLWPPTSPYKDENRALAQELRRFGKPFVAVPGNHDGYVGYHGLVNFFFGLKGSRALDVVNDYIPLLIRPPMPPELRSVPRYDGLAEWKYSFGPTSYAFGFRGQTFVGLNSYNLTQRERSGSGGVVFNWGGGVREEDVDWLEDALDQLPVDKELASPLGFLYMHHDPRGATPLKTTREEDRFGIYDEIEVPGSTATFGHFGLGHSPLWDIHIPVVTTTAHMGSRFIDDLFAGRGRSQQEWMKRSFSGVEGDPRAEGAYNAQDLVTVINDHLLRGRESGKTELSRIFFGHDDVPLGEQPWVWADDGGKVFPELRIGHWDEGRENHTWFQRPPLPFKPLFRHLVKLRNDEPPDWAKAMRPASGNTDVIRLDDMSMSGADHGFHVVTVFPLCDGGGSDPCVATRWIPLPSQPER